MAGQVHYEVQAEAPETQVALVFQLVEAIALAILEEVHDYAKVEPCGCGTLVATKFARKLLVKY
jgi:hypothetical protein